MGAGAAGGRERGSDGGEAQMQLTRPWKRGGCCCRTRDPAGRPRVGPVRSSRTPGLSGPRWNAEALRHRRHTESADAHFVPAVGPSGTRRESERRLCAGPEPRSRPAGMMPAVAAATRRPPPANAEVPLPDSERPGRILDIGPPRTRGPAAAQ